MKFDWRKLRAEHPRVFILAVVLKKLRTKAALVVASMCATLVVVRHQSPLDAPRPLWLGAGAILILAGVAFRFAAMGCLRKKEELATGGVYSLCRHPLYLGSMLMTCGFCFLLGPANATVNFIAATAYFAVFYPFVMFWEEIRLSERYGAAHERYAATTPLLLPRGRFHSSGFGLGLALRNGGALLLGVTVVLVAAIGAMAEVLKHH
jgi:protein-S-isoprenylcysteine O-methyltransferase Ste14